MKQIKFNNFDQFGMLIQIHKDQKLIENVLVGHGQKWVWLICSLDSKIDCISRINRWN